MVYLNLSDVVGMHSGSAVEIDAKLLIRDYVMQIDEKIVLGILLIFVGYFLSSLILPRALRGLDVLKDLFEGSSFCVFLDHVTLLVRWLISLCETLALGGACFVFGVAYYQGVVGHKSLWLVCGLLVVLLLIGLVELIGWVRNRKYEGVIKALKNVEVLDDEK